MKVLEKISDYAGKYMAIIALLVAIIALVFPGPVSSVIKTSYVNILLGIVMFGMGMTLLQLLAFSPEKMLSPSQRLSLRVFLPSSSSCRALLLFWSLSSSFLLSLQ